MLVPRFLPGKERRDEAARVPHAADLEGPERPTQLFGPAEGDLIAELFLGINDILDLDPSGTMSADELFISLGLRSLAAHDPQAASSFISPQPAVDRAPVHSPLDGDLRDRPTVADDRQHRLVPLFSHAHVPHERHCDQSAEVAGTPQPKLCDPSAEGLWRRVTRISTQPWCPQQDSNLQPWD